MSGSFKMSVAAVSHSGIQITFMVISC